MTREDYLNFMSRLIDNAHETYCPAIREKRARDPFFSAKRACDGLGCNTYGHLSGLIHQGIRLGLDAGKEGIIPFEKEA